MTTASGFRWSSFVTRSVLFDLVLALCMAVLLAMNTMSATRHLGPGVRLLVVGSALVAGLSLVVRRRYPVSVLIVALMPTVFDYDVAMLPIALYSLARYRQFEKLLFALVPVFAGIFQLSYYYSPVDITTAEGNDTFGMLEVTITAFSIVAAPVLLGVYVRARHRLIDDLRERTAQLERERYLLAGQALAEERSRIAREMHDVVAHRIGLAVIHTTAMEAESDRYDEGTLRTVQKIGDINRQALKELRSVLDVLRIAAGEHHDAFAPQPTLDDLPELIDQSREAGLPVTLFDEGDMPALSITVERTICRIVQESLTNVHKHAGQVHTEVQLRSEADGSVLVRVHNAAPGKSGLVEVPSGSHGIIGMRERVSPLHGEFSAGPHAAGGFEVRARLPAHSGE